jgi:hypothetical protein
MKIILSAVCGTVGMYVCGAMGIASPASTTIFVLGMIAGGLIGAALPIAYYFLTGQEEIESFSSAQLAK